MLKHWIGCTGWLLGGVLMACNASSSSIPQATGSGGDTSAGGAGNAGDTGDSDTGGSDSGGRDSSSGDSGGGNEAGGSGGDGGAANTGGRNTGGSSNRGGSGPCVVGDAGCDCYPNDTCNGDLNCESGICEIPSSGGASNGSGGTDAAGGSGGATSAGGSTSTSSGGTGPVVPGTAILPVDGWVDASTNSVGVQGSWYTYGDGISVVVPAAEPFFAGQGMNLCVSGSVPATGAEPEAWGVAIGMDLNVQTPEDTDGEPYDAEAHAVLGFRFTLRGTLPPNVQVNFPKPNGDRYCQRFYGLDASEQTFTAHIANTDFECWWGADLPPSDAIVQGFHVQILPEPSATIEFDFCLTNIQAIVE